MLCPIIYMCYCYIRKYLLAELEWSRLLLQGISYNCIITGIQKYPTDSFLHDAICYVPHAASGMIWRYFVRLSVVL